MEHLKSGALLLCRFLALPANVRLDCAATSIPAYLATLSALNKNSIITFGITGANVVAIFFNSDTLVNKLECLSVASSNGFNYELAPPEGSILHTHLSRQCSGPL